MTIDVAALKAALSDIEGIDTLTLTQVGGRLVAGFNGLIAAVDPASTADQIQAAIRKTASLRSAPMPNVQPQPKAPAMSTSAPGSFAAGLKALMDEARAGVAKARADGHARVSEAVGTLNDAKTAIEHVSGTIAKTIEDEAASVMSELGQISNDLGGGS